MLPEELESLSSRFLTGALLGEALTVFFFSNESSEELEDNRPLGAGFGAASFLARASMTDAVEDDVFELLRFWVGCSVEGVGCLFLFGASDNESDEGDGKTARFGGSVDSLAF